MYPTYLSVIQNSSKPHRADDKINGIRIGFVPGSTQIRLTVKSSTYVNLKDPCQWPKWPCSPSLSKRGFPLLPSRALQTVRTSPVSSPSLCYHQTGQSIRQNPKMDVGCSAKEALVEGGKWQAKLLCPKTTRLHYNGPFRNLMRG